MHLVEERRQVAPGRRRRRHVEVGVELGEDARPSDDLAEELADGPPRLHPELRQLLPALLQARPPFLGETLDLVEVLEGLGEQERSGVPVGLVLLPQRVALRLGEGGDECEVLEADPVARSQEDPAERDARQGVERGARIGEHLDDLRHLEQPRESEDLRGHLALDERLLQGEEQPRGAAEHGAVRPCSARVVQRDDPIRDPRRLLHLVGDARDVDLAGPVLLPRDEPLVRVGALRGGELADQHVGRLEDPRTRAEVGVQGSFVASSPSARANCLGNSSRLNSDAPRQA